MLMRDNQGSIVAEQNVALAKDGSLVISNTMFHAERVVSQHVSVTDLHGNTRTIDLLHGKILP
jgi:hypothetical protein